MARVMELYEALRSARSDEDRARVIAHAFEELEERFPNLGDMATNAALRETELRLTREIEALRKDVETLRKDIADLRKETTDIRKEIVDIRKETADLRKETADIRKEIMVLHKEIAEVRVAGFRHAMATVGLLAAFMTLLRLFG